MSRRKRRLPCELCGQPVTIPGAAACAFTDIGTPIEHERRWCFDCWDYDERAVAQYRMTPTMTV